MISHRLIDLEHFPDVLPRVFADPVPGHVQHAHVVFVQSVFEWSLAGLRRSFDRTATGAGPHWLLVGNGIDVLARRRKAAVQLQPPSSPSRARCIARRRAVPLLTRPRQGRGPAAPGVIGRGRRSSPRPASGRRRSASGKRCPCRVSPEAPSTTSTGLRIHCRTEFMTAFFSGPHSTPRPGIRASGARSDRRTPADRRRR